MDFKKLFNIKAQQAPIRSENPALQSLASNQTLSELDDLFPEAVRTVSQYDRASASLLQRRLQVGYARAARIIDELEAAGVIAAGEGAKPREVLVRDADEYLNKLNSQGINFKPKQKPLTAEEKAEAMRQQIYAAGQELDNNPEFQIFIRNLKPLINKFFEITERKVSILDEYGDENWDALQDEIVVLIRKIAKAQNYPSYSIESATKGYLEEPDLRKYTMLSVSLDRNFCNLALYLEAKFTDYHKTHKLRGEKLDIGNLNGREFEGYIAALLKAKGFEEISGTPITGDQGADLIAKKDGKKLAIQVKKYTELVGNKAVQEIVGAIKYYDADEGWVITNSKFTTSAKELAQKNGVKLIDGQTLENFDSFVENL